MKHRLATLVLLFGLPLFCAQVLAVDFDRCLADFRQGKYGIIGGTDNNGNAVPNISLATGLTYPTCVSACGSGQTPFQWSKFSQQFSSWLLPWLALLSQLPFGACDRLDNVVSIILTVGSPTLAAYSLAMTVLNGRWITRQFSHYRYPNALSAARVLSSLQQSPIEIDVSQSLLASLVVLPENDEWWRELVVALDYTQMWSISAIVSIAWVVIAFLFTVIDVYTSDFLAENGQGVGSIWIWLLPVVAGWLKLSPQCDYSRLCEAVQRVNNIAFTASTTSTTPIRASSLCGNRRGIYLHFADSDNLHCDKQCTAPIYNYARFLSWSQAVETVSDAFRAASDRYQTHDSVDSSVDRLPPDCAGIPHPNNRRGTQEQVFAYCRPVCGPTKPSKTWTHPVISRMVVASTFALILQWGSTGSAVVIVWFTPTRGLGCRSAVYITYGVLSTLVWFLLILSSLLAHHSTCSAKYRLFQAHARNRSVAALLSTALSRLGKVIATCNATWIVTSCLLQFSNFYNRCYRNSSVFSLRSGAYDVIQLVPDDISRMRSAWIGALGLASGTALIIFIVLMNILVSKPLRRE